MIKKHFRPARFKVKEDGKTKHKWGMKYKRKF